LGAQLLGSFNDNLFKMVVSLAAVEAALVAGGGGEYLSLTGVVFVLPYVLLSGYAGDVADRFDKRSVLIAGKLVELGVTALALVALVAGRIELLLATLLLLAVQATFFSPAKYGIVAETLPESELSCANGFLETSRYAAVILGTAVGGLLATVWHDRPAAIGAVLIAIAGAGALASLAIGRAPRPGPRKPFCLNPWREIAAGIRRLAGKRPLAFAAAGTTALEFLSALVLLDMILLGKAQMGLDDLQIGLLGGCVGLGAGVGALAAGRLSGDRVEPGLALIGAAGVGATLLALAASSAAFGPTAAAFAVLGAFGGLVVVPLNALLQKSAGRNEKGHVIATNNFLNMTGVLLASAALWILHDLCGFSPDRILILAGVATLALVPAAARARPRYAASAALRARQTWRAIAVACREGES